MTFGQIVLGPPGSGKTTYCWAIGKFLEEQGVKVAVVNLDPANEGHKYKCKVDISELVSLEEVQTQLNLGPNGGIIFCMEYLESNVDWLKDRLAPLQKEDYYLLFDLPGQVELWSNHNSLRKIVTFLSNKCGLSLCSVNLVDSLLCTDVSKFVSALLLSLSGMLEVELPHVNVLSKCDLARNYGPDFRLADFLECSDIPALAESLDTGVFSSKFKKLTAEICEAVDDYGLLDFVPLSVEDPDSIRALLGAVHRANGFVFKPLRHDPYQDTDLSASALAALSLASARP